MGGEEAVILVILHVLILKFTSTQTMALLTNICTNMYIL